MSAGELLGIDPSELRFSFELGKQISCQLHLSNKTDHYVAFKVKTTSPKKYSVRPNMGIILPRTSLDILVIMQAQNEAPPDMQCKDKFLFQCVKTNEGMTAKDITAEMFNKGAGNAVEECKLRVVYVTPLRHPSHVQEHSEEGPSLGASVLENDSTNSTKLPSPRTLKLEEKNSTIEQSNRLHQGRELLRARGRREYVSTWLMFVVIVAFIGLLLGFLLKKT
ncbi:hypothetical protein SAY87_030907 [Trapa incisa]|uniref:MSP domain-containing protein n=1 Tax=Trapa incisa TaxID=236973 RepID=A0AAN7QP01_9MYRT|nr:hypothetical protein SAY87_030907 [Trapa incisa]